MIAIVNYGSGNIHAIANIYGRLNVPFMIASTPDEIAIAKRIILPGVGAFDQAMHELVRSGMREALDEAVLVRRRPVLGICVGMQLLASASEEGNAAGLGWIDGTVRRFNDTSASRKAPVPHMGWNTVAPVRSDPLFADVDLRPGYYFLHSYYFSCNEDSDSLARTEYGESFTSVVSRENVYGVQFHPEKSHGAGIQLLRNFAGMGRESASAVRAS